MNTFITGGTGLIGRALAAELRDCVVLSRSEASTMRNAEVRSWRPMVGPPKIETLEGANAIVHLAGESVADGRWSRQKMRRIRDSRVVGTRNLVEGIAAMSSRPNVLVSASAVGFYGDRGDELLSEESFPGTGFLADVCRDWETEALRASELGVSVVLVRIGVVLTSRGGALARMAPIFRMGAGGQIGKGRQYMPWIHLDDVVEMLRFAIHNPQVGVMNAVAPGPVTNDEFTKTLAQTLGRPAILSVPTGLLRMALGEMSQIMLSSQRVIPRTAQAHGFKFKHTSLRGALSAELLRKTVRKVA